MPVTAFDSLPPCTVGFMNNPEILIATPAYEGNVKTGYVKSLFATQALLNNHGIKHDYMTLEISDIALARNYFASYMLERTNFTHLLFVDSDMTFANITVGRLLVQSKPLIGCVYPKRTIDLKRVIELARQHADTDAVLGLAHEFVVRYAAGPQEIQVTDGLARVAGLGMGLCLIGRSVFAGLLETGKLATHEDFSKGAKFSRGPLNGPLYGFFDPMDSEQGPLSEDLAFCERWRTLCGGDVWALVEEQIGHIGPMEFSVPYIERLKQGEI
jgi:hypothetical protein